MWTPWKVKKKKKKKKTIQNDVCCSLKRLAGLKQSWLQLVVFRSFHYIHVILALACIPVLIAVSFQLIKNRNKLFLDNKINLLADCAILHVHALTWRLAGISDIRVSKC